MDIAKKSQEAKDGARSPQGWPSLGLVEYEAVSARYAPHLDRVLHGVSFQAKPLERIGIVGRTGAGKSSLALALLRGLEIECGSIRVDGLDILQVDIHAAA